MSNFKSMSSSSPSCRIHFLKAVCLCTVRSRQKYCAPKYKTICFSFSRTKYTGESTTDFRPMRSQKNTHIYLSFSSPMPTRKHETYCTGRSHLDFFGLFHLSLLWKLRGYSASPRMSQKSTVSHVPSPRRFLYNLYATTRCAESYRVQKNTSFRT